MAPVDPARAVLPSYIASGSIEFDTQEGLETPAGYDGFLGVLGVLGAKAIVRHGDTSIVRRARRRQGLVGQTVTATLQVKE